MQRVRLIGGIFVASFVSAAAVSNPAQAFPDLPAGFSDELVAAVGQPVDVDFTPDGRMLVADQTGKLWVVKNGVKQPAPVLDLTARTCTTGEAGLLGVAVDPNFAVAPNNYIYVFNTVRVGTKCDANKNRVSRFTLAATGAIKMSTEKILIDNIPAARGAHNGGDVGFGNDGLLYISTGDGFCDYAGDSGCTGDNDAARDSNVLIGKILRITRSGGIPPSNPFQGAGTARCNLRSAAVGVRCQETYGWGLRNPFRIAFDPNAAETRVFVNDVGQDAWEEIDELVGGADYGWNLREGPCVQGSLVDCGSPGPGLTDPIHSYDHSAGCKSITGGAFVPDGLWPAEYDGAYMFSDYVCGQIFLLTPSGGGWVGSTLATGLGEGGPITLAFGPHGATQALYYTTFANGGEVRRISYTGSANRAPHASVTATPVSGALPLNVTFDASGSVDPDGDPLMYHWSFGDGTADVATAAPTVAHPYTTKPTTAQKRRTATLVVEDSHGLQSPAVTVDIHPGNQPPVVTLNVALASPITPTRAAVGEIMTLSATATDTEFGQATPTVLPASAFTWVVLRHHNEHDHPFRGPTTGKKELAVPYPPPEGFDATADSHATIILTVVDSRGLATTVTRDVLPDLVDLTFDSIPSGRTIIADHGTHSTPATVTSWQGYQFNAYAADQLDGGQLITSTGWTDGSPAGRTITTPAAATTYTAEFEPVPAGHGLQATYFDNENFTSAIVTRVDPTVDFIWPGSPAAGVGADSFSVRWTGTVTPRYSGRYTFITVSDDGVRLWVNGKSVINHLGAHDPVEDRGQIVLVAGRSYPIRVDYFDHDGEGAASLLWSSTDQPREVIPQSRLAP